MVLLGLPACVSSPRDLPPAEVVRGPLRARVEIERKSAPMSQPGQPQMPPPRAVEPPREVTFSRDIMAGQILLD
ncbi:MAG: hypothetical protein V2A34_11530, partial [Lentisphaerota bacterium]